MEIASLAAGCRRWLGPWPARWHKVLAAALSCLALAVGPVLADTLDDGIVAYNAGDYLQADRLWLPLAEAGDIRAQLYVGALRLYGRGVPQDYVAAMHWYARAARQGDASAQRLLGAAYEAGVGLTRDPVQALTWYRLAAEQGDAEAQHALAMLLVRGGGGRPDLQAAATWFGRAARAGLREAQFNLALMYAEGRGLPRDLERAHLWLTLASADGDADALREREQVARRMTPAQIVHAQALARRCLAQGVSACDTGG